MAKTHRVNVNFSEGAYKTLEDLAATKGKSMSEVLRDAIALEKWFVDTNANGDRVLVEKSNGRTQEIVPR